MNSIPKDFTAGVKQLLNNKQQIALLVHQNPDGDALGAALGLQGVLNALGHSTKVVLPNGFPDSLKWLPNSSNVCIYWGNEAEATQIVEQADLLFCVDFNAPKRVGKLETVLKEASAIKILIDHHPMPEPVFDWILSDTSVSSASELTYELINELGYKNLVNKEIAECILTGIITDTGCFSFNSSQPKTYQIVANLLALGVDKDKIYSAIFDNFSENRMRLTGYCLQEKLRVNSSCRTAYIAISRNELQRFNHKIGDTEGFVNLPLSISGIKFAVLFIENEDFVKISFRSKGAFSVNQFARKHFNGGGHTNASGGKSFLSLEETVQKFEQILASYEKEINEIYSTS